MAKERLCRKCNEKIPFQIVLEGKIRNLRGRKFCLKCSPFGAKNRFSDDPSREPKSRKFKERWANWSQDRKDRHEAFVYKRGIERKKELIKTLGGKCKSCGYDKCLRCLTFHHLDPSKKEFDLSVATLRSKKMDDVLKEVEKCELLCIRCHLEEEDRISMKKNKYLKILIEEGFVF